ncbi:hypothetical protein NF700_11095 [Sphingomonadaceae bacterium OTU29MARTA1]|uniref:hypothetical protein n=1 Tax=Sphingomonas sp. Leaf37 TaxID=2876552 RepID=UPI001E550087|nr:hypothetical protein [Sphingomonas sp. Leaf37]USU07649.1 hypothetical protein NF700_11095 [Sphingomonadaceae bacterium OTU29MARTA1]USU11140.1 hypothetical protein NF701_11275 [Sphingomonadaceae bacterium OTU29THOMA1]
MTDYVPIDATRTRGPRTGVFLAIIALAFVAGVVLTGYLMKHVSWLGGTSSVQQAAVARPAQPDASNFNPAQPLNASGEAVTALDPAALASREATLAGQLTALEARTAAVTSDAAMAAAQAGRAEGLMVAFAARRALDRGVGLGYLEEQLRNRFGSVQPRAVASVIEASRQPVTLEDLRQGLDAIAPDISTVSSDGWWTSLRREMAGLVVLRQAGTPSPRPADRLARARHLLEGGQVEAARAEVVRLPGAGDAGNWIQAADRYVTARHALDQIESAAIMGQASKPTVASATPAPEAELPAMPEASNADETTSVGM